MIILFCYKVGIQIIQTMFILIVKYITIKMKINFKNIVDCSLSSKGLGHWL